MLSHTVVSGTAVTFVTKPTLGVKEEDEITLYVPESDLQVALDLVLSHRHVYRVINTQPVTLLVPKLMED